MQLQKQLTLLQSRSATLAGRLGTAEKTLQRRDRGIAPLASRVLKSVFTVETDWGLGSGFIAWSDGEASYLLTANHVVAGQLTGDITVERKGGSWSGELTAVDPKHDLAVIRISAKPAGARPLWQTPRTRLPRAGDQLLLLGSPYGLYGTVTTGNRQPRHGPRDPDGRRGQPRQLRRPRARPERQRRRRPRRGRRREHQLRRPDPPRLREAAALLDAVRVLR